ncbi:MAG: nucleoside triphosphate pyrophosphohydrolase family protein [Patescibacteria group bacterium]|jgi:NTP pyrophosphatase (non-canonical NTP hydrolase)
MNFSDYQKESRSTVVYPTSGVLSYIYPILGLASEAGEVAQVVKKVIRDNEGVVSEEARVKISEELGDVLWYVAQIATEFNFDLDAIAAANLRKLASRMERGTIGGSGDNR